MASHGLEALKMNMLSGAAGLAGTGGSPPSSSVSSSLSVCSELYASNSLLFPKTCERGEQNASAVHGRL